MRVLNALTALILGLSAVTAQNVTNCVAGGVCYAVNIPESTSSSGTGDIFIQITGPTSMSWIGLGQGSGMTGSNIFMIYANAAGNNVTLSPRLGTGRRQPTTSGASSIVTLLAGSGIENSMMTANFKCSNCNSWSGGLMDFSDTDSSWIWAYQSGSSISSNSLDASLSRHTNYGDMSFNLQNAAGGSSTNPFLGTVASDTIPTSNDSNGDSGSSTDSIGNVSTGSGPSSMSTAILIAHGVLGPLAFAVFYPLGAIVIRLCSFKGLVWIHAGWMAFTYLIVLAALGLGVWLAVNLDYLGSSHAIIGLVVVAGLLLQPVTGLVHHSLFKRRGKSSPATLTHVWWGRAIITLGIINGGLGLRLAGNTRNGEIAYGVVAGVMWVLWMLVIIYSFAKSRRELGSTKSNDSREKMGHGSSHHHSSVQDSDSDPNARVV